MLPGKMAERLSVIYLGPIMPVEQEFWTLPVINGIITGYIELHLRVECGML